MIIISTPKTTISTHNFLLFICGVQHQADYKGAQRHLPPPPPPKKKKKKQKQQKRSHYIHKIGLPTRVNCVLLLAVCVTEAADSSTQTQYAWFSKRYNQCSLFFCTPYYCFCRHKFRYHGKTISLLRKCVFSLTIPMPEHLLLLVRQMETPVSPMKVAVHRRSLRLLYSLRATGVWSGQIPFLSGS